MLHPPDCPQASSHYNARMPNILLIEDETAIADTVLYALSTEGFAAVHVTLGAAGLEALRNEPFDLVVMDVGLPDANGFDLCRQLRAFSEVPVIFLTARASEIDRVVGLEIGADDYLTKPFSPRELVARIRVILRRSGKANGTPTPETLPAFRIDPEQGRIWFHGQPLDLTRYEYLLLKTLLAHPERIYSREQLLQLVWTAPEHSLDRTVDTHIKTLRAKLRSIDATDDPIRTHRGLGYSLSLRP